MINYSATMHLIQKLPTEIYGLKFCPTIEPNELRDTENINNNRELPIFEYQVPNEITYPNMELLQEIIQELGPNLNACLEILIDNNGLRSLSRILIEERPAGSFYLGVMPEDRHFIDSQENNTWTLEAGVFEQPLLREFLISKGIETLDLIVLRGNNSVNECVENWKLADLLSPHGIIVLCCTNYHPGKIALCEAIDQSMFTVTRHFIRDEDWGMAVVRPKIQNVND